MLLILALVQVAALAVDEAGGFTLIAGLLQTPPASRRGFLKQGTNEGGVNPTPLPALDTRFIREFGHAISFRSIPVPAGRINPSFRDRCDAVFGGWFPELG